MVNKLINATKELVEKTGQNSDKILFGLGVAGIFGVAYFATTAQPKATKVIEDTKKEIAKSYEDQGIVDYHMSKKDIVKAVWPVYVPTALCIVGTVGCFLLSSKIKDKKYVAVAVAAKLTEDSYKKYRNFVEDTITPEQKKELKDKLMLDKQNELTTNKVTTPAKLDCGKYKFAPGDGDVLFYESLTGRYFYSTVNFVRRCEDQANRRLSMEGTICVREWHDLLGLESCYIGDWLEWNVNDGDRVIVEFGSDLMDIATQPIPCIVINYRQMPSWARE